MTLLIHRFQRSRSWRVALLVTVLLVAAISRPRAAATELFISEYIEGSSNNKAIEIYNDTGASIDLAAGGYNVQMFFNGNPDSTLTINLVGTVATGDVFVLASSSANATILAQTDQTSGSGFFNGDDAVVLRKGTTVVDAIGQAGFDPGSEWGTGLVSTADNTLRRKSSVCTGDANASDVFDPATEWEGFATDTFGGLGAHTATCTEAAPTVVSTYPANNAVDVPTNANLLVTFSEPVSFGASSFTLACTVSGPKTAVSSGGPTTFTVNPDSDFVAGEACTFTVVAAQVSDTDPNDPPDTMVANFVVGFSAFDVCAASYTPTWQIQGSGATSPLAGNTVTTRGVVVGDYEGAVPTLRGFYIQDATGDGNALTSDGLFVFNGSNNRVSVGDVVVVTGTVAEFQGQTQASASSVNACGTATVTPVDVTLPIPSADFLERYEGMLVRLPQALVVTEHFQLGRFGQVVVSSGARLRQPTDVVAPGSDAEAMQVGNNLNRLIIDDASNAQNPDPIVFGRGGAPLSAATPLRAGDTATNTVGVMTYTWSGNAASGNAYRVRPLGALGGFVRFDEANPRPGTAPAVTGSLRVASMNLLNFFNTSGNLACALGVGGAATECRGASNDTEFARQWPKTLDAILGTGADIVGVIEVENDGYGPTSAVAFLVDQLNAATAPGTWAFVDVDARTGQVNALGTDAIKVGLLYKPARVVPVGQTAALNTPQFVNGGDGAPRNRPSLAQAFEDFATGARFVVSVNHLKSKGSACDAPDTGDGQGECNVVRTNAANLLTAWLASDPTATGDPDALIVGDLNAYGMEDPVRAITDASYTNLVPAFGGGHSYVFDGQWGSLDHALASASLRSQVTAAHDWYINADEPGVLDYNTEFKSAGQQVSLYAPDRFRMSDHNPLIVDLDLVSPLDASAMVNGAGEIVLSASGGLAAGDAGSEVNFAINVKFGRGSTVPEGHANLVTRRTEVDGVHTYQVKATTIGALLRDAATGQAVIVARATIRDITTPESPVVIDSNGAMRVTVDDNGNPGVGADTIGMTVLNGANALWFSSNGNGTAVNQVIVGGNLQVR
jgi:uncharacterized protein